MQFIYILHLSPVHQDIANWNDNTNNTMSQHWNYLVGLHEKGMIKLVGRTDYAPGHKDLIGIAIFSADSLESATEIMNNDPCVRDGVMTATVHPFSLSLIDGKKPEEM